MDDKPVCDMCAFGKEEFNKWEKASYEKYGWVCHAVTDDPDFPFNCNIHTHGLPQKYNHPDLQICLPVDPRVAHRIICNAIRLISEGTVFKAQDVVFEVIENYPVTFANAIECDRPVLRIIFPDNTGRFKKDEIQGSLADQWKGTLP